MILRKSMCPLKESMPRRFEDQVGDDFDLNSMFLRWPANKARSHITDDNITNHNSATLLREAARTSPEAIKSTVSEKA